jgi:ferrous iron transport protein B
MGGVILVGSMVIWFLTAFPRTGDLAARQGGAPEAARIDVAYEDRGHAAAPSHLAQVPAAGNRAVADQQRLRHTAQVEQSLMGRIGKALAPIFAPLGIDWRGGVALVSGFVAKEIVVSTLGVLYAADEDGDADALRTALKASGMTPLSALSMMIFVLLYLPCLATVIAIRQETGSLKWMLFSVFYSTSVAWLAAFCVYQGGRLLGLA